MIGQHASPQCPQCGGSLPRQALWRTVNCSYCGAVVTLNKRWVERAEFSAALHRAQARPANASPADWLTLNGHDHRLLQRLGTGSHADVWLAERHGNARLRAVLKLQREPGDTLAREADTLRALHRLQAPDSAYYALRLPQPLGHGRATGAHDGPALALRAWPGFRGSLADVLTLHAHGLNDPRHVVWLWRRVLELLGYLHRAGWCHRDLRAEHWLIHPADHGVHLVGWGAARQHADPGIDLQQSACTARDALGTQTHAPAFAALLQRASEDRDWCRTLGAEGLHQQAGAAAQADFGPPRFVAFDPLTA